MNGLCSRSPLQLKPVGCSFYSISIQMVIFLCKDTIFVCFSVTPAMIFFIFFFTFFSAWSYSCYMTVILLFPVTSRWEHAYIHLLEIRLDFARKENNKNVTVKQMLFDFVPGLCPSGCCYLDWWQGWQFIVLIALYVAIFPLSLITRKILSVPWVRHSKERLWWDKAVLQDLPDHPHSSAQRLFSHQHLYVPMWSDVVLLHTVSLMDHQNCISAEVEQIHSFCGLFRSSDGSSYWSNFVKVFKWHQLIDSDVKTIWWLRMIMRR